MRLKRSLGFALAGGLSGGLVGGGSGGLVGLLVGGGPGGPAGRLASAGLGALLGAWGGLGIGLLDALVAILIDKTVPVLRASLAVRRAGIKRVVVIGLVGGLLAGLYSGLVSGLVMSRQDLYARAMSGAPEVVRLLLAMPYLRNIALGLLPVGLLFRVLRDGLITGEMVTRTKANQGMRRSAQNALLGALAGGLAGGLIGGAIGWFLEWMAVREQAGASSVDLYMGLLLGSVLALAGVLIAGPHSGSLAYFQHLALRFVLWRNDLAPWRYVAFLDYATERIFLRKVGGGYIYIHRLLRDYFAELWEKEVGGAE
jgi:hypothetical protein